MVGDSSRNLSGELSDAQLRAQEWRIFMKKITAVLLTAAMCAAMLIGCGGNGGEQGKTTAPTAGSTASAETQTSGQESTETSLAGTETSDAGSETGSDSGTQAPEASDGSKQPVQKTDISVAALKGPTAIGMVKLMEDAKNGTAAGNYQFTIAGAADEITASLLKGDIQIAAVPSNLASVLYNRSKGGIRVAAVNTLGVLYIVETGDTVHSVADLKGKTIYSTGAGTTPEYTLRYLLTEAGLDPDKDVTIEFKSEATEVAALLSQADDAVAMLPQPFVTTVMMNNDKVRIALDVTKEWEAVSENGSSVVTGVVAVNAAFLEENKEAFDAFLEEYDASAKFVNESVEEAAALVESFDIFKAAVAVKAIPLCNVTFIRGDEMKEKLTGYLQTLYDQNPDSVGGAMPGEDFYYME